jgi:hypothetical protein
VRVDVKDDKLAFSYPDPQLPPPGEPKLPALVET